MISKIQNWRKNLRIPISIKLITATLVVLFAAVGPVVYQSTQSFQTELETRELTQNLNMAEAKATEINNVLQSLLEKAKTLSLLSVRNENRALTGAIDLLLEQDRDLFAVDVFERTVGEFTLQHTFLKPEKLAQFGSTEQQIDKARLQSHFSFDAIAQGQIEIRKISASKELPIIGVGFPLARDELGRTHLIAVAYISVFKLQKIFSRQGNREVFLVDKNGRLLSHPDEKLLLEDSDLSSHPIFQFAASEKSPSGQRNFSLGNSDDLIHGAYARTVLGPIVIAQIPDSEITKPAELIRRKATIITGFVVSGGFLLVFLLSLSLVGPIERLAGLIRRVSKGDYDISARTQIQSQDEVGDLAGVFDEMVVGLKERAKAYAVMKQAMGASVVETLMSMKEEELGGQKKPVTVLFSDLRDFTKFSEGHTPEEVVIMLNEYFDVMVKIINRHGGWLDKFIGDAIMAVWGVPYTGEQDEKRAVQAALEMRVELAALNERRIARGQGPCKIGIGLHCGDAIVGKIGATERANLTVIGDTVNQSSRIEASTKAFGTDILVSQELEAAVRDHFALELAGKAEVKGKSEALHLYKLKGLRLENGEIQIIQTPYSEYQAEAVDKVKAS